jgi:hypothetical protein
MSGLLTDEERAAWEDAVPEAPRNRTDAGNGEHFARLHGDRVRYDHRRKLWLVWADHWWRSDEVAGAPARQACGARPLQRGDPPR